MTALTASRRALCALAMAAPACAIYGPDLVIPGGQGGSAGAAGSMGGVGAQGAAMPVAGTGGDVMSGGTAGDAASGAPGEGGQPPEPATVPYLTVAIGLPLTGIALTSDGSLDWAHWGLGAATDYNHKAAVTSQLLDFKPTGAEVPMRFLDGPTTFSWSDGTPTASGNTNDGISWRGVGEGFELTVPAALEVRKLRLYVGVFNGTGALTAALSDPRSNSIGDDKVSSPSAMWVLDVVSITYGNADQPDTTMTVTWSLQSGLATNAMVSITALSIGSG